jgi:hypothetical protein
MGITNKRYLEALDWAYIYRAALRKTMDTFAKHWNEYQKTEDPNSLFMLPHEISLANLPFLIENYTDMETNFKAEYMAAKKNQKRNIRVTQAARAKRLADGRPRRPYKFHDRPADSFPDDYFSPLKDD